MGEYFIDFINANYMSILAGAVVYFVLGGLWYELLFKKQWLSAMGMSAEEAKESSKGITAFIGHFVLVLITTLVLSNVIRMSGSETWMQGLTAGFWVWFGFMLPILGSGYFWEKYSLKLLIVNGAYHLVAMMGVGAMLVWWPW